MTGFLLYLFLSSHQADLARIQTLPASYELAPSWVECPYCRGVRLRSYVVSETHRTDENPEFVDECGFHHFHDASYDSYFCECEAGHYFFARRTASPCACGWPDDPHVCPLGGS